MPASPRPKERAHCSGQRELKAKEESAAIRDQQSTLGIQYPAKPASLIALIADRYPLPATRRPLHPIPDPLLFSSPSVTKIGF